MNTTILTKSHIFNEHSLKDYSSAIYNNNKYFNFISELQKEIGINNLIKVFHDNLKIVGINYHNSSHSIDYSYGNTSTHEVLYNLFLDKRPLGNITFYNESNFTLHNKHEIETYLSLSLYPLKNAIKHHEMMIYSLRDSLTGVANRSAFFPVLQREINLALRYQQPLSIITFDVDDFKSINDSFGHGQGDAFLKGLINFLNATLRDVDIMFRTGGDEFTIILTNTDVSGATIIANRLLQVTTKYHYRFEDQNLHSTISLGISKILNNDSLPILIERVDKALYHAKALGGNCFHII